VSFFAKGTRVSVEKSRAALDTLLKKHGATARLVGVDDEHNRAMVGFAMKGARFRLHIPLPVLAGHGKPGEPTVKTRAAIPQAERERWRLVLLLVKAKLEAIALGLSTANREFLADMIVDQDDRTLEEVLNQGGMSRLLLTAGPPPRDKGQRT
jgi:hypothetical protein